MARPLRIFYRGAFFTSPAAVMNENNIFQDDRDRLKKAFEGCGSGGKAARSRVPAIVVVDTLAARQPDMAFYRSGPLFLAESVPPLFPLIKTVVDGF